MDWLIHPSVTIHPTARIDVRERLVIGAGGVIGEDCEISGRNVEIGQELWMDRGARIGGGSCFDRQSFFRAGHFLHMGQDVFINTARLVEIGDEVGLGTRTAIYTHGAYLSALDGFPVSFQPVVIGSRVWLPGATVNPGVMIGNDVVVGVGSVITQSLPGNCLAAGVPAKVIRQPYPTPLTDEQKDEFWSKFSAVFRPTDPKGLEVAIGYDWVGYQGATFYIDSKTISGVVSEESERLRNELRRYGIRFHARPSGDHYEGWTDEATTGSPVV